MTWNRKALALSLGLFSMVSAATVAQQPRSAPTLVVEDATVDWIQRSDVSALRPGVIEKMELRIGKEAGAYPNNIIGYLHSESAQLAVAEAKITANSQGPVRKAEAQKEHAIAVVARNQRLNDRMPNAVSREEMQKAEAELAIADASVLEAKENQSLAQAKLRSAEQTAEEHIIRAPFPGVVFEEIKHEGESVNSNEAVVRLGNLERLRVWAYIPVAYRQQVVEGCDVEIQTRLGSPMDQKRFRGKVSFVDPKVQPVSGSDFSGSEVRIYADIDNESKELVPGMRTAITIILKPEGSNTYAAPRPASSANLGARPEQLPAVPRR